jgi:hypothetical protein
MSLPSHAREWIIPLSDDKQTLGEAYEKMQAIALAQESIPLLIQLVENPKYDLPGIDIFSGATDLATHDYIHILLGRGLLPKDEAFILGFTMGSTNRLNEWEERLYGLFTKYLYPKPYRFSEEDFQVYKDAARLGYISGCEPLNTVDYPALEHLSIKAAREKIGIEVDLLRAYFTIEAKRYPHSYESQRLINY